MDYSNHPSQELLSMSQRLSMAERLEKWRESKSTTTTTTLSSSSSSSHAFLSPPPISSNTTYSVSQQGSQSKLDKKLNSQESNELKSHIISSKDINTKQNSYLSQTTSVAAATTAAISILPSTTTASTTIATSMSLLSSSSNSSNQKRMRNASLSSPNPKGSLSSYREQYEQNIHPNVDDKLFGSLNSNDNNSNNNNTSMNPNTHDRIPSARRVSMMLSRNSTQFDQILVSSKDPPSRNHGSNNNNSSNDKNKNIDAIAEPSLFSPSKGTTPDILNSKRVKVTNSLLSPSAANGYSPDLSLISSVRSKSEKSNPSNSSNPPQQHLQDMEIFMKKYLELKKLYQDTELELNKVKSLYYESQNIIAMSGEEIAALQFLNSVQEIRIGELENNASTNHIKFHENNANKNKKHKTEIIRLQNEKIEYEERANSMIQQMSDQMSTLQSMAMSRIEVLEKDLMESRRKCERLEEENTALQSAATFRSHSIVNHNTNSASIFSQEDEGEVDIEEDYDEDIDVMGNILGDTLSMSLSSDKRKNRKTLNRRLSTMFTSRDSSLISSESDHLFNRTWERIEEEENQDEEDENENEDRMEFENN